MVIAFGVFDGVHLGHRRIVETAKDLAAQRGALTAAVTFAPHPRELLAPGNPPQLLCSLEERRSRLLDAGADLTGVIRFDRAFADLEPQEFLGGLLKAPAFELAGICVGEDWRFGRRGAGDPELLRKFAQAHGLLFTALPKLQMYGQNISSTAIREAVAQGEVEKASAMLGRAPELSGIVERGFGIAAKDLNAPTANLVLMCGVMPADGVYAGVVTIPEGTFGAVMNIGIAPTYGGTAGRRIEIHLIGFSGSLYDRDLSVRLLGFLRKEQKFDTPSLLKKQIICDLKRAAAVFKEKGLCL